jgi:hypothetical protein
MLTIVSLFVSFFLTMSNVTGSNPTKELANVKRQLADCKAKLSETNQNYLGQVCSRMGSWIGPKHDPAMKTTISKLLKHFDLESEPVSENGDFKEKQILLRISNDDLVSLRRFILVDEGTDEEVQDILVRSFITETSPSSGGIFGNVKDVLNGFSFSQSPHVAPTVVLFIMLSIVATIGLLLYRGKAVWKVLLLVVVLSVSATWCQLYYQAAAKKQATLARLGNVPGSCRIEKQGWGRATVDFVRGLFNNVADPCEEYYAAAMVDPLWEVSILDAITETVCRLVVRPVEALGTALGRFFTNVIDPIPFAWKLPILILCVLILVIALLLYCRYEVGCPLLFYIKPPPTDKTGQERITNKSRVRVDKESKCGAIENENNEWNTKENSENDSEGLRQRSLPYPPTANCSPFPISNEGNPNVYGNLYSPEPGTSGGFRFPLRQ